MINKYVLYFLFKFSSKYLDYDGYIFIPQFTYIYFNSSLTIYHYNKTVQLKDTSINC